MLRPHGIWKLLNMDDQQLRREECRREVRRYLAERQALAFPAEAIQRKLRNDGDVFSLDEIEAALSFLIALDPPQVKSIEVSIGATRTFQATSSGVLAHERRQ